MPEAGRVLVTGGAGYIGSTLVPRLLARGFRVTVLDLQDPVGDAPACAGHPALARRTNVRATARLVSAAGPGLPVILASTLSCYGRVPEGRCDEDTPARPLSLYARTKLEAEALVLASPGGIALRLATVYGLSPRMRLDLLVNDFAHTLARGRPLSIFEPEARRPFLHVADAARAFLFALENAGRLAGGLYNVGEESQNLSKRELAEHIGRHFPGSRVSCTGRGRDRDRRDYAVSFARFRALGFRAEVSLEQGLEELAGAFRPG